MTARKRTPLVQLRTVATALVQSAVTWFCVFVLCGFVLMLVGLYVLAGAGWTFLAGGLFFLGSAWFLRLGIMTHV